MTVTPFADSSEEVSNSVSVDPVTSETSSASLEILQPSNGFERGLSALPGALSSVDHLSNLAWKFDFSVLSTDQS
jgi:hypothetical protein